MFVIKRILILTIKNKQLCMDIHFKLYEFLNDIISF